MFIITINNFIMVVVLIIIMMMIVLMMVVMIMAMVIVMIAVVGKFEVIGVRFHVFRNNCITLGFCPHLSAR